MANIALLFPGQGAQYVGMGKSFFENYSTAAAYFTRANQILGYSISDICFYGPEDILMRTEHCQPAIFLVSWVAFKLLTEQIPDIPWTATAGLSLGEITALTAASVFSFEDGLWVVKERANAMQKACELSPGAMAAVIGLSIEQIHYICDKYGIMPANYNCPGQVVVSGDREALHKAVEEFRTAGARRVVLLPVAGAFHSPLMEPAANRFKEVLRTVAVNIPSKYVYSNVTARAHEAPSDIVNRLVEQLVSPVKWEQTIQNLIADGYDVFIELGPGSVLSGFIKRINPNVRVTNVEDLASLNRAVELLRQWLD